MPKTHKAPSPNFDDRPAGEAIDTLLLHYTGMKTAEAALTRLVDAEAKVSAHYMVHRNGDVYEMVAEEKRAWHAGVSFWRGKNHLNSRSIGIEIDNPGHEFGYIPFTEVQMASVVKLCQGILKRHAIPPRNVIAHSDVAPDRKEDPGELFDWSMLAREGIGLFPALPAMKARALFKQGDKGAGVLSMQKRLLAYGYNVPVTGEFCAATAAVVRAFQRHFDGVRREIDGVWDNQLDEMISALINMVD
jgi:N-acetylmuramoyl-L-alanine amidase